jgi:penicillin amidase
VALKRVLFYFNIAVLVALLVGAVAIYWVAWRPLPETSGTLEAPVGARLEIARDKLGVPHVSASSVEDALFAQGYAAAQDRLWQMDTLRRLATGRLAEVFGPEALESDRESRRFRISRIAQAAAASLQPADHAPLAAYARGVNWFIETHRGRLGLEFALGRYDPPPWSVQDSLAIALQMHRWLSFTWRDKLQKAALLEGGDASLVNALYPLRLGPAVQPGSNAWVIAGARTASGRPLLANDPHLEYSLPGIWHMVHLRAPGLDVSGVALPGVPCVIIGHNERIAWGVTNLGYDDQDLYIERIDLQTGRYLFRGQIEQAHRERELIPARGAAPVEFAQWVTRHGPVFVESGRALALRWSAAEPGFAFPMLDLNRAGNWGEFLAALARYPGPGQNFVYADVDGNIGSHAAGRLPLRRNYDGDVPVDGASGEHEWDGWIPFAELPQTYNPASGIVVSANEDSFPLTYPYRVHGGFAAPYRAARIRELLEARRSWRASDMLAVQKDVYSTFSRFLAREILAAWDRRGAKSAGIDDAVAELRSWNGQMEKGSAAPLIVTLLYEHLRQAIAERASPGKGLLYQSASGAAYWMAPAVIERLLRERPAAWFRDYDQLLLAEFLGAIEEGRRIEGRNIRKWDYGRYNQLLIAHPVGSRLPLVSGLFNIGPEPQSGSATTVKQTTRRIGPSMRTGVDLADLDNSYMNIVAGESGHVLSRHYKDQWPAYYGATSFPLQFRRVDADETLTLEPLRK